MQKQLGELILMSSADRVAYRWATHPEQYTRASSGV